MPGQTENVNTYFYYMVAPSVVTKDCKPEHILLIPLMKFTNPTVPPSMGLTMMISSYVC